jgi:hypothetical protein
MPRIADSLESKREDVEGQMACLGNALVLIDLTVERLGVAIQYGPQVGLLVPAVQDLQMARRLVRRAQRLAAGVGG